MQVHRKNPGCFIFLLDQSASMSGVLAGTGGATKADALAARINELLESIILRCVKARNEPPRHYFDIGLIGYGTGARSLFSGALAGQTLVSVAQLADAKERIERDATGRPRPIWFEPVAGGVTYMCAALELAGRIVDGWTATHRDSPPPIVINITDGYATDGDPEPVARRLTAGGTDQGRTLLFNFTLSELEVPPLRFPSNADLVGDEKAKALFRMSSPLPQLMRQYAVELGVDAQPDARGFVLNADAGSIVQAIDIGTRVDVR